METLIIPRYISAEEFDLMFDDELDTIYDDEYHYRVWLEDEKINKQIKSQL